MKVVQTFWSKPLFKANNDVRESAGLVFDSSHSQR